MSAAIAELNKVFGVRCTVRALFDEPTARGLAGRVDALVAAEATTDGASAAGGGTVTGVL